MLLIITIFLGLVLGSLVNACVWRIHNNSTNHKKESILTGRSICPSCKHILAPIDLIPIVSWIFLKGKCRYCSKPISIQYPLVEAITLLFFLITYFYYPIQLTDNVGLVTYFFSLIFVFFFIAMSVYDIKWMILPNSMVYGLLFFVVLYLAIGGLMGFIGSYIFLMGLEGVLVGGGIFFVLYQLSDGKWIGGGDVRLGAVLGLLFGSGFMAFLMIFLASLIGTLYSLPMLLFKKNNKKTLIPFGPFLLAATFILMLFGNQLHIWLRTRGFIS